MIVSFSGFYLTNYFWCQILGSEFPSEDSPLQSKSEPANVSFVEGTAESADDCPKLLLNTGEQYSEPELNADKNLYDLPLPAPYDMDVRAVKHEFIGESSKSGNSDELDYLLDEPLQENPDNLSYDNVGFIEASDLSLPVEANSSPLDMLDDYLTFYDANVDEFQDFAYESLAMLENNDIPSQPLLPPQVILLCAID